jgi:hypothetical protein
MNDTNREASIHALREYSRQLDYFVSFLEGYDEEFLALLRSAAENVKSALERLDSLKKRLARGSLLPNAENLPRHLPGAGDL